MSALTESLGQAAPPHEFVHDGKTYIVRLVDQAVKAGVEKRLYERARELLRLNRADLTEAEWAAQLRLINADYQAGEFAFESERGQKYLQTPAGVKHLTALLFQVGEDEMERLLIARGMEVAAMVDVVLRESFPLSPEKRAELEKKRAELEREKEAQRTTRAALRLY